MENNLQEQVLMELIIHGGNARSKALEAINIAKTGEMEKAKNLLEECEKELRKAHQFQTKLIQSEAAGETVNITLLIIHGQDHLMNAITVKDLAKEVVAVYERLMEKGE